jgi:hypothetical protein
MFWTAALFFILKLIFKRFSSQNHKLFEFFGLVTKSTTYTGLIFVKISEPISQAWAPLMCCHFPFVIFPMNMQYSAVEQIS